VRLDHLLSRERRSGASIREGAMQRASISNSLASGGETKISGKVSYHSSVAKALSNLWACSSVG
jgi:hypothetical protein